MPTLHKVAQTLIPLIGLGLFITIAAPAAKFFIADAYAVGTSEQP